MDAVKFLKAKNQICEMYDNKNCFECPLGNVSTTDRGYQAECLANKLLNEEEAIAIVEKWVSEHPIRTRQSEFLKMFPNANIRREALFICPQYVDKDFKCLRILCDECRKAYWLAEVDDEDKN